MIKLTPDGHITLKTKQFDTVQLGQDYDNLSKKLEVLAHLSNTLPNRFLNKKGTTIDITDPLKPELQLERPSG